MDMMVTDCAYDDLLASQAWRDNLADLNETIADSLRQHDVPVMMNGNLFYNHKKRDFPALPFVAEFEDKRRNFFELARRSSRLFEIGVNGGHSLLLALMANPDLHAIGIDVCAQLDPRWARVDIYVPAAFRWLEKTFLGRVQMIAGNSLVAVPEYCLANPDAGVDFLHLDGAKDTHLREVLGMRDAMQAGAFVVHDDFNAKPVRLSDRQLRRIGVTRPLDYEEHGLRETRWHVVRALA